MLHIAIAGDHASPALKKKIIETFSSTYHFKDFGTCTEESVDYPDFAHPAAKEVSEGTCDFGILICGSGNGVQMTANKYQKIRCALAWTVEVAALARQHNDANMLALPARFISEELALEMVKTFLATSFEGGRHQRRVDKIAIPKEYKE